MIHIILLLGGLEETSALHESEFNWLVEAPLIGFSGSTRCSGKVKPALFEFQFKFELSFIAYVMYQGKQDMQNSLYSSFLADHQITKSMIGLPSLLQVLVIVSIF